MSINDSTPLSTVISSSASAPSISRSNQHRNAFLHKRKKMSRCANLIGICGVSSLCIFLLIATTQHRPLPSSIASSSSSGTSGSQNSLSSSTSERQQMQSTYMGEMVTHNLTAIMHDVFALQRSKIAQEMENFEYPLVRFAGVYAEKLSDLTPETEGTPVRSIIITTWRSGSTFLGDILNAMPGNYYHYEPLLNFEIKQIRGPPDDEIAINNLKNLLYCDYSNMEDYLEYGKDHRHLFEHNERLWSQCKQFPQFCWKSSFLTPFCKLFPLQSMKIVRLRLALAERLLEDKG